MIKRIEMRRESKHNLSVCSFSIWDCSKEMLVFGFWTSIWFSSWLTPFWEAWVRVCVSPTSIEWILPSKMLSIVSSTERVDNKSRRMASSGICGNISSKLWTYTINVTLDEYDFSSNLKKKKKWTNSSVHKLNYKYPRKNQYFLTWVSKLVTSPLRTNSKENIGRGSQWDIFSAEKSRRGGNYIIIFSFRS